MTKATYKKFLTLITYAWVLLFLLFNIGVIFSSIGKAIIVLKPLWYGISLAFVLNIPMNFFETNLFNSHTKLHRGLSLIISIMFLVCILTILFIWVIPDFVESLTFLIGQSPKIMSDLNDILVGMFSNTDLSSYVNNLNNSNQITGFITSAGKGVISNFSSTISNLAGLLVNLITGFIIAIYLLLEKEFILGKCKLIIYKIFDDDATNNIKYIYRLSYKSFHDFVSYQCIECFILASIMFAAFIIFGFPYALTIAFLTGITAVIPIFGATIACVIGAILIGTVSLEKMIIFVIVFQVIQQIENNLIYPHVVGKNVGLPPILTLIAIIVGGKCLGLFGVLICVPLTSIINTLFWALMDKDLPKFTLHGKKKKLKFL